MIYATCDSFMYGLIAFTAIEFIKLGVQLRKLREKVKRKYNEKIAKKYRINLLATSLQAANVLMRKRQEMLHAAQIDLNDIKPLVIQHVKLLEIRDNLEEIYQFQFMLQFITSSFVICFTVFKISITDNFLDIWSFGLTLVAVTIRIYLQCYFSQLLKDSSLTVAEEFQQCGWEEIDNSIVKQCMNLIQIQSQKSAALRIMKFSEMSLEQFTKVMALAYSYYTLCRYLYEKM